MAFWLGNFLYIYIYIFLLLFIFRPNLTCTCYPGFKGENCAIAAVCDNNCNGNGDCLIGKCFCYPGYKGESCSEKIQCSNNCNNNGQCLNAKCFCDAEFLGEDCSERVTCKNDCNNKGICFKGKCLCEPGYFGEFCEDVNVKFPNCQNNCNNNGVCNMGKCFCYHGFTGDNCELKLEFSCPPYKSPGNSNDILNNNTPTSRLTLKERTDGRLSAISFFIKNSNKIKEKPEFKNNKLRERKFRTISMLKNTAILKPCNGNGICQYGKCFCFPGFKVI